MQNVKINLTFCKNGRKTKNRRTNAGAVHYLRPSSHALFSSNTRASTLNIDDLRSGSSNPNTTNSEMNAQTCACSWSCLEVVNAVLQEEYRTTLPRTMNY